ncbi:MAG: radical SAM protein [Candidatus Omnitrophica bacterium]|nr:radical SAM protein [Candidatus Omnitrophota bacterium]
MIKGAILYTTSSCNLNCAYCFVEKKNDTMRPETLIRIMEWLQKNISAEHDHHVSVMGGEPMLYPDLIYKLADLTRKIKYSGKSLRLKGIPTNGSILDKDIIKSLKEKNIRLDFSLDGYTLYSNRLRFKDKKIFGRILNNLAVYTREIGAPVIKMTVHPDTAKFMHNEIALFHKNKIDKIQVMPAHGVSWGKRNTDEFMANFKKVLALHKKLKKSPQPLFIDPIDIYCKNISENDWEKTNCNCGLGEEIVFTPSGDAYACTLIMHLRDSKLKDELYLGNVYRKIDLGKMRRLKGYRICSLAKINCRYLFPDITCKKICALYDFRAKKMLDIRQAKNLIDIQNFMFHETYSEYFTRKNTDGVTA